MGCGASKAKPVQKKNGIKSSKKEILKKHEDGGEEDSTVKLYAFKDTLRQRVLPMIEARSSCENLDLVFREANNNNKEEFAALRIQKQLRRKLAKNHAEQDQKWMIFSNVDAFDEAEMVKLAQFMEIVMEKIGKPSMLDLKESDQGSTKPPLPPSPPNQSSKSPLINPKYESHRELIARLSDELNNDNDNRSVSVAESRQLATTAYTSADGTAGLISSSSSSFSSSSSSSSSPSSISGNPTNVGGGTDVEVIDFTRSASAEKLKALNMAQITVASNYHYRGEQVTREYDLPAGVPVDAAIAKHIIDVYKQAGKLSTKAVTKLLRLTYRKMQALPNTAIITIGPADRLVIVGDIHGQLPDLMHILDDAGLPSATTRYIFNGDFVDRGPCGVEVMCVLMALFLAFPDSVALNRGNHEDFAICCCYGFQKECFDKYDADIFGMFSELFQQLPLFCVVNKAIFVLHGGLFHSDELLLSDLDEFDRTDFSLKDLPEGGDQVVGVPRSQRAEFFKQVQRDALWSDPVAKAGLSPSSRGAGINFGPDVTRTFLERNGLNMVVRSHEVCRTGFDLPFAGVAATTANVTRTVIKEASASNEVDTFDYQNMLCTIFSASNYSGGGNSAAYMVFALTNGVHAHMTNAVKVGGGCSLHYKVQYFHIDREEEIASMQHSEAAYTVSLHDLILKKREYLLEAFELSDPDNTGRVSRSMWTEVMQRVLQLQIRWLSLVSELVPENCLVSDGDSDDKGGDKGFIDYKKFVSCFRIADELPGAVAATSAKDKDVTDVPSTFVDSLYQHHRELLAVFSFFDRDGDGLIAKEEFRVGCELLLQMERDRNIGAGSATTLTVDESSGPKRRGLYGSFSSSANSVATATAAATASSQRVSLLQECETLMNIMDINQRGVVDINEFFEMFRVAESLRQQRSGTGSMSRRPSSLSRSAGSFSLHPRRTNESVEIAPSLHVVSDPELAKLPEIDFAGTTLLGPPFSVKEDVVDI